MSAGSNRLGVVAIGRNEGERLRRCLQSVFGHAKAIVYVDSGSTDDSSSMARTLGCEVVELDMRIPFTAARARNAGFERLRQMQSTLSYVQFVDGDCEIVPGWLDFGVAFLDAHPDVAAVCGRRRERFPQHSIYNLLCDIEWNTPVGEAKSCGGDVMMRVSALTAVRGYREDFIAGEEPELCVRLRHTGWRIWRLDAEMTLHDAAISHFSQWWKRSMRAGYSFAAGAALHGAPPERHKVRETRSVWFWGLALPLLTIGSVLFVGFVGLSWLALYPLQIMRLALRGRASARERCWQALFLVLGKFPEAAGQLKFIGDRLLATRSRLIEYK